MAYASVNYATAIGVYVPIANPSTAEAGEKESSIMHETRVKA